MTTSLGRFDARLAGASRLPPLAPTTDAPMTAVELAVLLTAGVVASLAANTLRLRLGIPGSSIVQAAIPLALGLSLVPRRGAGTVMSIGALGCNAVLTLAHVRLDGVGAQTSLLLTGPLLELALRAGFRGWRLYLAFIGACAASNAAAFVVRTWARMLGVSGVGGGGGGHGLLRGWFPNSIATYALCGIVAGLLSAGAWFHLRDRTRT